MSTVAADIPVIELAHPLPGFPHDQRFALVRLDDDGVLMAFRSLEREDLQFVVVPPSPFYPDYAPEISDDVVTDLEIGDASDVLVLLVVHAGASLADTTVNLRAPLVINTGTRRACQVVLDDPDLPLAAPLMA
ncbi:flagellar assembly factor FliW [Nocardioides thalensis]|uniref:Flagellar assembly factor FliW n=1 Tax=Nocardioides thalensis TaxID=1914755 RepID=A0A853BZR3_9ACTN|nr:flagellar assembly protein FliW [Nocardioides thalensis]NYI99847.1 flagellar assembly factor FliW [Nocardioides thalensis]